MEQTLHEVRMGFPGKFLIFFFGVHAAYEFIPKRAFFGEAWARFLVLKVRKGLPVGLVVARSVQERLVEKERLPRTRELDKLHRLLALDVPALGVEVNRLRRKGG